jgi:hypothetical protein
MFTYFQGLSDVAEFVRLYRERTTNLTLDQGKVLDDILVGIQMLADEEDSRINDWADRIRDDESVTENYGGTD